MERGFLTGNLTDLMVGVPGNDVDVLRRRVLNVVGHELRTPVSTVSGLSSELEQRYPDDDLVEAIARNARRLDHLVDDLLLAAAIGTVVPIGDPVEVDLVGAVRAAWRTRGDEASLAVQGEARVRAREVVVAKVLDMVIDNALVHGAPPFAVTASVDDGRAVLEVANGGPVVSDDELALAVEAFYRTERGVTNAPGLGLGLAIANTLVTADGGTLSLRPGEHAGVVARIELPAA